VPNLNVPEPKANLVPIRQAYFPRQFWEQWDQMMDPQRAAYTLGWIAELENVIRRMEHRVDQLEECREEAR